MKSFDGYLKKKLGDAYVLLAGGGELHIDTIMSRLYDDGTYKYSGNNPYYAHMSWNTNSDNRWYLRVSPETPKLIAVDWAYGAPWSGLTGVPSTFTPSAHDHNKIVSLGDYSYANISTNIPVNALSYKIVTSGGTDLGDTQYNVIHIPWSSGDWGSYILFGANNGRVGVKYKHGGAVRELITSANFSDFMDSRYVNVTGDTMSGALNMSQGVKGHLSVDSAGIYILSGNYWLRALVGGVNDCLGALSISNYLTTSAYANIGTYLQTGTYAYIKGVIANNNYKLVRLLGQYTNATSSCTGTIKIALPNNSSQYQMHYIRIHIYEYSSLAASTITVGGHDWNGNWYNYNYTVKGNYNKGVRLGYDGAHYCILLGTTSTTWSYPGVWVDALDNVYNNNWDNVFLDGCACSLITSESGITTFSPSLGNSYASTFYGALSGNASTASALLDSNHTANTITASYYSGGYTSSPAYLTAWSGYHLTYCEPKYVTGIGSANKLATARSLWGNTFDGTQNLTGRLTVTSDIRFTPSNSSYEVFQFGAQNSGTHNGYIYGETNSYYLVFLSGNTGVGVSPSMKLDVNGAIKCRSHIYIDNTSTELDITFQKNGANKYLLCGHDANFIFYRYNGGWKLDTLWNYSTGGWTFNQLVYFNRGGENTPSIRWNKSGTYWGGIGYGGTSNENVFGPVDANGNWVTSTSPDTWTFRGNVKGYNFYTTSDRLKKQNISSFSEHIRKFQLKDTEKWHYGVIAQEVPEMFRDGEEGNMTVNYNSVLSFYIGLLENRVKMLEDKLKKYEEIQNI